MAAPVRWRAIKARVAACRAALVGEAGEGRGFLWLPVFYGIGITLYFVLPGEPVALVTLAIAAVFAVMATRAWMLARPHIVLLIAAALLAGLAAASVRTAFVEAPRLDRDISGTLTGWIEAAEPRPRGAWRLIVRPVAMERFDDAALPGRIRITTRGQGAVTEPGRAIEALVRLGPPAGAVMPGAYDFSRVAYFRGIGGVGFSYGATRAADLGAPSIGLTLRARVERLRTAIAAHVIDALPGEQGAIAAALLVGQRGAIGEDTADALRVAGLAHVLAISGLHMSLVAATLFGAIRGLLAASPALALRYPIKKWAAAGALVGVALYLVMSGAPVSAQRAAVTAAVALGAIMIGRQAISMRVVAIAALAVMTMTPEAVMEPGFQMSFAAVVALVATYERTADHLRARARQKDATPSWTPARRALAWGAGLALTAVVAGLATTPMGAYHFYRVQPLGILSNLAALPVVSAVVMPAGVAAAIAAPFGLEIYPLKAMGAGIEYVVAVARTVAEWTPGGGTIGQPGLAGTLIACAGGLWLCLWTSPVRWVGLPVALLGAGLSMTAPAPHVLISPSGERVLAHDGEGFPRLFGRGSGFEADVWLRAAGFEPDGIPPVAQAEPSACDRTGCAIAAWPRGHRPPADGAGDAGEPGISGLRLALVDAPEAFLSDCAWADIVVTRHVAPAWCAPRLALYDGPRLSETGAVMLWIGPGGRDIARERAARDGSQRPWTSSR